MAENVLDGKFICGNCQYFIADDRTRWSYIFSKGTDWNYSSNRSFGNLCKKKMY